MFINLKSSDENPSEWAPIKYYHYYDFSRFFQVKYKDINLVFDAPFLELNDEYSDYFIVYLNDLGDIDVPKECNKLKIVGIVPVSEVTLDKGTHKKFILINSLEKILSKYVP